MGFREIVDPVAGRSLNVPYYNLHFAGHGSFSTDRDDIYPRVDPWELATILDSGGLSGVEPGQELPVFAFWNWPNPFHAASKTTIVLSLPQSAGAIDVAIFDAAGRKVREIYTGQAQEGTGRFVWDGCTSAGGHAPAGVYLCQVKFGSLTVSRKLTLLK